MISKETTIACRAPRRDLWRVLADTERFNREANLAPMKLEPDPHGAARFVVKSQLGPFSATWREQPFQWIEGVRYGVRREVISGPIAWVEIEVHLDDRDGGTDVRYVMTIEPNRGALSLVVGPMLGGVLRQIETAIRRIDDRLASGAPPPIVDGVREDALAAARATLVAEAPARVAAHADRLIEWIRTTPDHAARRLRPFALAETWGVDRRDVLELCLAASVAGLLELTWSVVCPSCRTSASELPSLAELGENGHCELCDLSFGVELDRAVEATFQPAPAIREVPDIQFCSGGPATMPHVIAQAVLAERGEARFVVPDVADRFRLFARGGAVTSVEVCADAPNEVTVRLGEAFDSARLEAAPGATVVVKDDTGEARHVKLERLGWASQAATAYEVSTLETYRRRFSHDVLRPGAAMRIGRAALLFSDLSASTQLYSREGDAAAFRLVQEHFDLLAGAIGAHDGAIVKTIGDAVMAAFVDEVAAVRAALEMLRAWPSFVEHNATADGVALKIGVYAGPCYAVTANGVLDYFGQTVNLAARLQGQAKEGELVVTQALAERLREVDLGVLSFSETYAAELKGIDDAVSAVRITIEE